ncbi:MAG: polysaccharide deacetylase family protein [Selenomonadaceae bacterium]|nr:polysaccharide deacetylase family protein [Selenomonadaceae bacterium]
MNFCFRLILIFISLLLIFEGSAFLKPQRVENENKIMVLNYHKIDDVNISLSIPPAEFDKQMKYLKDNDYHTITPDELYASIEGREKLPENPVLITFDDGYSDNYKNAYPILKKYDFKATIFVISSFVGNMEHYVTWDEVREMSENGITIASHTVDHRSMTDLTDAQLKKELEDSKAKIEEELGKKVDYIAYPTGTYNLHIAEIVRDAGYKAAFTIKYGIVDAYSNIYALERIPIFQTEDTHKSFLERIRYAPAFESIGWIKN